MHSMVNLYRIEVVQVCDAFREIILYLKATTTSRFFYFSV